MEEGKEIVTGVVYPPHTTYVLFGLLVVALWLAVLALISPD
jgi:hypothetical protein